MPISSADIIEAIIDELVVGDFAEGASTVDVSRSGPGALNLDYGSEGRFTLTVTPSPDLD